MGVTRRVLFVANTSWYLWKFRASTLKAFCEAGFEVTCIAPLDGYSRRLQDDLGCRFEALEIGGSNRGIIREVLALGGAVRAVKRLQPEYVFNFTIKPNIYFGLACAVLNVPFANNVSGLGTAFLHNSRLHSLVRRFYVAVCNRADRVFFQNESDHKTFANLGLSEEQQVSVLPGSGVDLKAFLPSPLPSRPLKFLMVARLLGDKGVREYVQAARIVRRRRPELVFVLVGPAGVGNKTAISLEEVLTYQREEVIDYRGELSDVRAVLKEAHVLVLPSYGEGMPRTVLEAAAAGRPAIVSNVVGCINAVVPGKTGLLCAPRSVESLVCAIETFVAFSDREIGEMAVHARELAEHEFSEDKVVAEYLQCVNVDVLTPTVAAPSLGAKASH